MAAFGESCEEEEQQEEEAALRAANDDCPTAQTDISATEAGRSQPTQYCHASALVLAPVADPRAPRPFEQVSRAPWRIRGRLVPGNPYSTGTRCPVRNP